MTPSEACKALNITAQDFAHLERQYKALWSSTNTAMHRSKYDLALEILYRLPESQWPIRIKEAWKRQAERFRDMAERLGPKIDAATAPMTQNATPKRVAQYHGRRLEGARLERTRTALLLLADQIEAGTLPAVLHGFKSKKDVYGALTKKMDHVQNGYHPYTVETDEYHDQTPAAVALQRLVEGAESDEAKEARKRAEAMRRLEEEVRFADIPGFFPTPKPVIEKMLRHADLEPGMTVLEPSAGKGDICDAIAEGYGVKPYTCEIVPTLRNLLEKKGYGTPKDAIVCGGDFMRYAAVTVDRFDRILMNPPFEKGQDAEHIMAAFGLLGPGGQLVAICSEGPFFRTDKKSESFRDLLQAVSVYTEKLPADAFKAGAWRQTGVRTRLVVLDKPEG